jgi:hypothetical protein
MRNSASSATKLANRQPRWQTWGGQVGSRQRKLECNRRLNSGCTPRCRAAFEPIRAAAAGEPHEVSSDDSRKEAAQVRSR